MTSFNNSSGHYLPTVQEGMTYGQALKNAGVSVSGANVKLYNSTGTVEKSFKAN